MLLRALRQGWYSSSEKIRSPAQASSDEAELQRLEADISLNDVLLFRMLAERAMAAAPERMPRTSSDSSEAPHELRCDQRPHPLLLCTGISVSLLCSCETVEHATAEGCLPNPCLPGDSLHFPFRFGSPADKLQKRPAMSVPYVMQIRVKLLMRPYVVMVLRVSFFASTYRGRLLVAVVRLRRRRGWLAWGMSSVAGALGYVPGGETTLLEVCVLVLRLYLPV